MLERLDVDVAGPAAHRVGQQAVDQLDDRGVVNLLSGRDLVVLFLDDLDILIQPLHVLEEVLELLLVAGGLVVALDQAAKGHLARDDGEEIVPGNELEVVEEAVVRGVGHRHRQRASLALERQHDVLGRDLAGNQLQRAGIDLELGQVDGRHPVVPGQQLRHLDFGDGALLHHHVTQAQAGRLGLGGGRRELVASQQTFLQKEVAEGTAAYRH